MPTDPLPTPATPAEILPVVREHLEQLAALPPGPAAQSKVADILQLIVALLTNPAISSLLPVGWKLYVSAVVAGIGLLLGGGLLGRYVVPSVPVAPVVVAPVVAPVTPPIEAPIVPPAPIVAPSKLMLYVVTSTDVKDLTIGKLPAGVYLDAKVYADGSTYPFGGKSVPLPCMAALAHDGKVIDVVSFVSLAEVVAYRAKQLGK